MDLVRIIRIVHVSVARPSRLEFQEEIQPKEGHLTPL
jgi:hypothetical protein